DIRAGAFEQCLGDEESEAQPGVRGALHAAVLFPAAHIRIADAIKNFRSEAGAVVLYDDADEEFGPARFDPDGRAREIDRVFHEIAEAVQYTGVAQADRLGGAAFLLDDD